MNQLTTYSSDIKRLHSKAQQHAASAIQCAMDAGQLLIEAKSHVKHGEWLPFVESTGVNERTARNYMHLARNQDLLKSATVADMGIKKALEYLAEPKVLPVESDSVGSGIRKFREMCAAIDRCYGHYKRLTLQRIVDDPQSLILYEEMRRAISDFDPDSIDSMNIVDVAEIARNEETDENVSYIRVISERIVGKMLSGEVRPPSWETAA